MSNVEEGEPLDLLVGIPEIARFLSNQPERRVRHWHDTGQLPTKKVGNLITSTKSALRRHFGSAA
jgi:hypothetical protein